MTRKQTYSPAKMVDLVLGIVPFSSFASTYIHMYEYCIFMIGPFNTMINSRIEQGCQLLKHPYFKF
jgi:hypothetical protein